MHVCIHTYIYIYKCVVTKCKCVPQMGRIYVTQNDNKNDNKSNPKAIFKHHGPLITLPKRLNQPASLCHSQRWRQPANLKTFKKRSSSKHVVATCGYGEFAPRSVFAAKV